MTGREETPASPEIYGHREGDVLYVTLPPAIMPSPVHLIAVQCLVGSFPMLLLFSVIVKRFLPDPGAEEPLSAKIVIVVVIVAMAAFLVAAGVAVVVALRRGRRLGRDITARVPTPGRWAAELLFDTSEAWSSQRWFYGYRNRTSLGWWHYKHRDWVGSHPTVIAVNISERFTKIDLPPVDAALVQRIWSPVRRSGKRIVARIAQFIGFPLLYLMCVAAFRSKGVETMDWVVASAICCRFVLQTFLFDPDNPFHDQSRKPALTIEHGRFLIENQVIDRSSAIMIVVPAAGGFCVRLFGMTYIKHPPGSRVTDYRTTAALIDAWTGTAGRDAMSSQSPSQPSEKAAGSGRASLTECPLLTGVGVGKP